MPGSSGPRPVKMEPDNHVLGENHAEDDVRNCQCDYKCENAISPKNPLHILVRANITEILALITVETKRAPALSSPTAATSNICWDSIIAAGRLHDGDSHVSCPQTAIARLLARVLPPFSACPGREAEGPRPDRLCAH